MQQETKRTWTKKNISIVVIVGFAYGVWFNFLDSAAYCNVALIEAIDKKCLPVGMLMGGNIVYQPWNIIGHFIPGLFLLLFMPKKVELFFAGFLISTAIMDSVLWGVIRIGVHDLPLWHMVGNKNFVETTSLMDWIVYYYHPLGFYRVWEDPWFEQLPDFPTAAFIFWSIVGRVAGAIILILWQDKQERLGEKRFR